jgi:type VI secretion system secreted protein VgrG
MSTIKSLSSKGGGGFNEIRFEDKKGEEQIFIHAQKNQDIRVHENCYEYVGKERHLIVCNAQKEKVSGAKSNTVGGDHRESIGKDHHLKIKGKQAIEIGETHSLKVTGDFGAEIGGNLSQDVTGNIYLKAVGTVVIESTGGITLKCGGNSVVIDSSGVSVQGTMVTIQGSLTKINSGSGSPAGSGQAATLVPPAAPAAPEKADEADPGEMTKVKAREHEQKKGKYGSVPVTPFIPPDTPDPKKTSWVAIKLSDEFGQPVAGEPFKIELPDGTVVESTLDSKGEAKVEGIDPGNCKITFTNLDTDAWENA